MRQNLYTVHVMTGGQLRDAREDKGWTQARLAEELGMEPEKGGKLVSSWENMDEVPRRRESALRRILFPEAHNDALLSYSTTRLVAEITAMVAELARRADDDKVKSVSDQRDKDHDQATGRETNLPIKPKGDRNAASAPSGRRQNPAQGRAAATPTRRRNDAHSEDR